jgi:hypothetical protein
MSAFERSKRPYFSLDNNICDKSAVNLFHGNDFSVGKSHSNTSEVKI